MMLQYWQGLGCEDRHKTKTHNKMLEVLEVYLHMMRHQVQLELKVKKKKLVTHCSKLFDVLSTFLADCIGFTVKNKQGFYIHNK